MTERFVLAFLHWCVIAGALVLLRKRSPTHLFVLALFSTALVGTFYPLLSSFIEPSTWRNVSQPSEALVLDTQKEYLAYAVGLFCALLAARALGRGQRASAPVPRVEPSVRRRDLTVAFGLITIGAALYLVYLAGVGIEALLNREDYAEKYLLSSGLGPFAFGIMIMIAGCLWAEASDIAPRYRNAARMVAAGLTVWSVGLISVRTNVVVLCLGYAWIFCTKRRVELQRVRLSLVAALLVTYVGLEGFSLFRGATQEAGLESALTLIGRQSEDSLASVVGGSELSHPFLTTMEVAQSERAGELGGRSYLDAIPALAPIALVPDRPETLSEGFVRTQYGDIAARGGGAAFSLVAEAWWNFGEIVGPLVAGLVFGLLLLFLEHLAARSPHGALARLTPYCLYLVVIAHRSESAILTKQLFAISMPVVALLFTAETIRVASGDRAQATARPTRRPARTTPASRPS
jgi:hypothetical protein